MAVTYAVATKNNRLKMAFLAGAVTPAAAESVDSGAGVGTLVIGTAALAGATGVIATIALQKPSVTISAGVATIAGVPLTVAASAAGVAANAALETTEAADGLAAAAHHEPQIALLEASELIDGLAAHGASDWHHYDNDFLLLAA